ncbi:unnamed protein product [Angiostrongylus costaricensis]|nr:unnamed protein product [Angiostrongylus costaricensis]VDM63518.1 unnamed protein product [Angiostrongylus costaricensis]
MFLDRLRNTRSNSAYVAEYFDGTALYTNVTNYSPMQAFRELPVQQAISVHGFSIQQLMIQIRELAMGKRLA